MAALMVTDAPELEPELEPELDELSSDPDPPLLSSPEVVVPPLEVPVPEAAAMNGLLSAVKAAWVRSNVSGVYAVC